MYLYSTHLYSSPLSFVHLWYVSDMCVRVSLFSFPNSPHSHSLTIQTNQAAFSISRSRSRSFSFSLSHSTHLLTPHSLTYSTHSISFPFFLLCMRRCDRFARRCCSILHHFLTLLSDPCLLHDDLTHNRLSEWGISTKFHEKRTRECLLTLEQDVRPLSKHETSLCHSTQLNSAQLSSAQLSSAQLSSTQLSFLSCFLLTFLTQSLTHCAFFPQLSEYVPMIVIA